MSNLSRRPGSGLSRSKREARAFRLVAVGGGAVVVGVIATVLAIAGVIGSSLAWLCLAIAIVSGILFRQTVAGK
jgi:predicted N-acetyltransferase YhbS